MGTALLHNRIIRRGGGFPDFSFSGNSTVLDTGETSGKWEIAFTSTGILTLNEPLSNVTIKAQGAGGGGGAGYASGSGSDGYDGSIETTTIDLDAIKFSVVIGAGGSAGSDSAGGKGGDTSFDTFTATGGAGGAYKGGASRTHDGLYSTYGHGGAGGTTLDYTATTVSKIYIKGTYAIYSAADPNSTITGYMSSGTKYYVTTTTGTDGKSWWKLSSGGYVPWTSTSSAYSEDVETGRKYYGTEGNPGVIILSGRA